MVMYGEEEQKMEQRNELVFQTLLRVTVLVAIIALVSLLITKRDTGPTVAFDVLAYVLSFTALILTTLQSISIARQVRITRHASAKITETLHSIEKLTKAENKLSREIAKDTELDERVIAALSEQGVGSGEKERAVIARAVAQHIRSNTKRT